MKEIEIYEEPGITPTDNERQLSGLIASLTASDYKVSRYDPLGTPEKFAEDQSLSDYLAAGGALPLLILDGRVRAAGSEENLIGFLTSLTKGSAGCGGCQGCH